jgi:5-bromo-4-chloroindolyl phosphate hydrolysis protein
MNILKGIQNSLYVLFSEKSSISIMRIMSMIALVFGGVLALIGRDASIVSIFVYAAFAGKATQRYFESKETSAEKVHK